MPILRRSLWERHTPERIRAVVTAGGMPTVAKKLTYTDIVDNAKICSHLHDDGSVTWEALA